MKKIKPVVRLSRMNCYRFHFREWQRSGNGSKKNCKECTIKQNENSLGKKQILKQEELLGS